MSFYRIDPVQKKNLVSNLYKDGIVKADNLFKKNY